METAVIFTIFFALLCTVLFVFAAILIAFNAKKWKDSHPKYRQAENLTE